MNIPAQESRRERGLSQFEMILVMAVMGVITAVAFPLFSNLTESSKLGVLKANLHHMNAILREVHRAGSVSTNIDLDKDDLSVGELCTAMTTGAGVFVDQDGDGNLDAHEIGFEMDMPSGEDPYDYLVGQHLFGEYSVKIEGSDPVQLAIYDGETLDDIP